MAIMLVWIEGWFRSCLSCSKMSLADDVNLDEFVMTKDDLSGADIKAICTESGLLVCIFGWFVSLKGFWSNIFCQALRERRMKIMQVCWLWALAWNSINIEWLWFAIAGRFQEGQGKGHAQEKGRRPGGPLSLICTKIGSRPQSVANNEAFPFRLGSIVWFRGQLKQSCLGSEIFSSVDDGKSHTKQCNS